MKNTIKQVFHSGKFLVGFVIFVFILVYIIVYPLVVATSPMEMIGNGNFFPPGTYISQQEAATTSDSYQLNVDTSASKLNAALGSEEISAPWQTGSKNLRESTRRISMFPTQRLS